jgi:hypothetical protein
MTCGLLHCKIENFWIWWSIRGRGGGGAWVAKDIHEALDMADVLLLRLCLYFV